MRRICVAFLLLALCLGGQAQDKVVKRPTRPATGQQAAKPATKSKTQSRPTSGRSAILKEIIANMVFVEGGLFKVGYADESKSNSHFLMEDTPPYEVGLGDYHIGRYEVTQKEWRAVMGSNPSRPQGDNLPVNNVSWNDCQRFVEKLNDMTSDHHFSLPSEAHWEWAARGGKHSRNYEYAGGNDMATVSWNMYNSKGIHRVGQKQPNELGLYDMSGNVAEWTSDWYDGKRSKEYDQFKFCRVLRGGCWWSNMVGCTIVNRDAAKPDKRDGGYGLRLLMN